MYRTPANIIRRHYELTRQVTDEEVAAEIASLTRKAFNGTLDDKDEILAAKLKLI